MMEVTVKLFARARDLAGAEEVTLTLPPQATVGDLRRSLSDSTPSLEPIAAHLLVAIGNDYADDSTPIPVDAVVACFPPVSGG